MYLLFTVIAVSIDACIAGISCNAKSKDYKWSVLVVGLCTFILCYASLMLSAVFSDYITYFNLFGAVVFIFLGVKNILDIDLSFGSENIALGVAVSLDASIACLAMGSFATDIFLTASLFAVFHSLFFMIGQKMIKRLRIKETNILAGITLILLGVLKLL